MDMHESGTTDSRPKLLIVDDDDELCSMLVEYLGPEGFATETVGTGPKALERLGRSAVDLVVLDVMLPELSGFEVLRRIRAGSRVPVRSEEHTSELQSRLHLVCRLLLEK